MSLCFLRSGEIVEKKGCRKCGSPGRYGLGKAYFSLAAVAMS